MPTRRDFLRLSGLAGAAGLALKLDVPAFGSAQLPGQNPLPGAFINKYVDPLPTFFGERISGSNLVASMEEFQQRVLPSTFVYPPPFEGTYVWGYRISNGRVTRGPNYPGFTVETQRHSPVIIKYVNNLPYPAFLQKYLTVDQTLHWANPLGLAMDDPRRREPYQGPIPLVTHLHGAEVPSEFDGGPEAWFTMDVADLGALHGPAYRTFAPTQSNAAIYRYPNRQEATTLWFHDHSLGMTRLDVFAGLATFYLIRDSRDTGLANNDMGLPAGPYEVELALQDRQFDTNGQLFFPDGIPSGAGLNGDPPNPDRHPFWIPEFFGDAMLVNGKTWPYLEVEPRRYRFRFLNGCNARFLRVVLSNQATGKPGPPFWVISTDGGFLDRPVKLNDPSGTGAAARPFFLSPAERFDVIIDFNGYLGQTLTLLNDAPAPYPSGDAPDPDTAGQLMQFRVVKPLTSPDATYNPASGTPLRTPMVRLANPATGTLGAGIVANVHRQLVLVEVEGPGGPIEVLLNNTEWPGKREINGMLRGPVPGSTPNQEGDFMTEVPRVGSTEVWEIANLTEDAHPIHIHLLQFQIMNRQGFDVDGYRALYDSLFPGGSYLPGWGPPLPYRKPNESGALGGNPDQTPFLQGSVILPDPEEAGWKDTIKVYPDMVTRIVARFAPQDQPAGSTAPGRNYFAFDPTSGPGYVWHCHILDHEDNEMMRPYNLKK